MSYVFLGAPLNPSACDVRTSRRVTGTAHQSAGYTEDTFQIRRTKIKLHKNLGEYIYNGRFFFPFIDFFFKTFLIFIVDTFMLHRSKAFPVVCSIIVDMQVSLLSRRTKPPHHIPIPEPPSPSMAPNKNTKNAAATHPWR